MALDYLTASARTNRPGDNENTRPGKPPPSSPKRTKLLLLLAANVIVAFALFEVFTGRKTPAVCKAVPPKKGVITAILYSTDNPSAVIECRIVHEGDMISGYKVQRIYKDRIELEKDGAILIKYIGK